MPSSPRDSMPSEQIHLSGKGSRPQVVWGGGHRNKRASRFCVMASSQTQLWQHGRAQSFLQTVSPCHHGQPDLLTVRKTPGSRWDVTIIRSKDPCPSRYLLLKPYR